MLEGTEKEIVSTLKSVLGAMNELEVKGKQNHVIVVACMNDLDRIITTLNGKENRDGNLHTES